MLRNLSLDLLKVVVFTDGFKDAISQNFDFTSLYSIVDLPFATK